MSSRFNTPAGPADVEPFLDDDATWFVQERPLIRPVDRRPFLVRTALGEIIPHPEIQGAWLDVPLAEEYGQQQARIRELRVPEICDSALRILQSHGAVKRTLLGAPFAVVGGFGFSVFHVSFFHLSTPAFASSPRPSPWPQHLTIYKQMRPVLRIYWDAKDDTIHVKSMERKQSWQLEFLERAWNNEAWDSSEVQSIPD